MDAQMVEQSILMFPRDRDLRRMRRQLEAAQRSDRPTRKILKEIEARVKLLNNGGKKDPEEQLTA